MRHRGLGRERQSLEPWQLKALAVGGDGTIAEVSEAEECKDLGGGYRDGQRWLQRVINYKYQVSTLRQFRSRTNITFFFY